ncbi:MAG: glucose-6-phosphate dehydrogenase assembly protein OpcA [Thermoleophilia bacterium]
MSESAVREDWNGTGVAIGDVLDRLAAQRRPAEGAPAVGLTGVLNLLAYAPGPADLEMMSSTIERLADRQPSRAVLLTEAPGGDGIDATVSTSCRLASDRSGVALETIVLTLHGEAIEGAASAAVPLLRPDLPTVLWWPGPPSAGADGPLERLAGIADRVVTEAGRAPGDTGLRALARWVPGAAPAVTDLAWAHITSWRQLIVQMIDEAALESLRGGPSTATLTHAAAEPDAGTLLLAGWLREVVGETLAIDLRPGEGDAPWGPVSIGLVGALSGRHMEIERVPGRQAAAVCVTEADGTTRRRVLPLPDADRARLLAGELELQRRDRAFERALARAAALETA